MTVGEVADLAQVSVRTLHHYDEIGLLRSGRRTDAGYRLYGPAELARQHIGARFYDCPSMMHTGLADMYEADARFSGYFEKYAEGLTTFVSAAIRANAARVQGTR